MSRIARLVVPGLPHHITQRGNRRQAVFFTDEDWQSYLRWLAEASRRFGVHVWAYCLMTNHVHLVVVPEQEGALAQCLAEVHSHYARRINGRMHWKGHLWQARFGSSVMDHRYALAVVRYVEQNPVRAAMVKHAWEYAWSSARYHVGEAPDDPVVREDGDLRAEVTDWRAFLEGEVPEAQLKRIRRDTPVCRPLGADGFIKNLEARYGLRLERGRRGRPPARK